MSVKDDVLYILEASRGKTVSGEKMAATLGVSRNAVFKAVNALRADGREILSSHGGYVISPDENSLSLPLIAKYLGSNKYNIQLYNTVSSTNTLLRSIAESGGEEWTVAVAEAQTAGRGRLGKSFASPEKTGIYTSVLLRPRLPVGKTVFVTVAAAVAVARAIEKNTDRRADIKWVNDIYSNGKKVCGILTEASFDTLSDSISYAVVGVGINVAAPKGGFGTELDNVAGALCEKATAEKRAKILADFLDEFSAFYENGFESAVGEYRARQILVGKDVEIIRGENRVPAKVVGVDENCRLCVVYPDGTEEKLLSGEVSAKLLN